MTLGFDCTVFIPARDAGQTIGETIRSVVAQQLPPARVAVIDDHSADDTPHIARAMGVEVLRSPGRGLADAQNFGIREAQTEFVTFVDSDDIWLPAFVATAAPAWRCLPPDAVACASLGRSFSGRPPPASAALRQIQPARLGVHDVWERNPMTKSATVFRLAALQDVGGYRDISNSEDYDLLLRLQQGGGSLWLVPSVQCLVRIGRTSRSSDPASMLTTEADSLRAFFESPYRKAALPMADLEARLRTLWYRTVAATANRYQPLRSVPPIVTVVEPRARDRLVEAMIRSQIVGRAIAAGWRTLRQLRGHPRRASGPFL